MVQPFSYMSRDVRSADATMQQRQDRNHFPDLPAGPTAAACSFCETPCKGVHRHAYVRHVLNSPVCSTAGSCMFLKALVCHSVTCRLALNRYHAVSDGERLGAAKPHSGVDLSSILLCTRKDECRGHGIGGDAPTKAFSQAYSFDACFVTWAQTSHLQSSGRFIPGFRNPSGPSQKSIAIQIYLGLKRRQHIAHVTYVSLTAGIVFNPSLSVVFVLVFRGNGVCKRTSWPSLNFLAKFGCFFCVFCQQGVTSWLRSQRNRSPPKGIEFQQIRSYASILTGLADPYPLWHTLSV